jgi:hypothetical protein
MRKIMFIALAAFLLGPIICTAQVSTKNSYGTEIDVSTKNGGPVSISNNATKNLTFLTVNESSPVTIFIRYRNGSGYKVDKKEVLITSKNLDLSPNMATYSKGNATGKTATSETQSKRTTPEGDKGSSSSNANLPVVGDQISLIVRDSSTHRFMVIGPTGSPFLGIALAPGQISKEVNTTLGLHQLTALVDMDPEGSSTGKNFSQAVIKLIVVADQEEIVVRDENITPITSGQVKVQVKSSFPFRIVFMSGKLAGKAMKRNLKGKYDFDMGFNSLSIQFFKNGIRYQADLEFALAEGDKTIVFGENYLKNVVAIDGYGTY